jgi:hypothetical protein
MLLCRLMMATSGHVRQKDFTYLIIKLINAQWIYILLSVENTSYQEEN